LTVDELGPLSIIVELQTYVAAIVIYVATHFVKVAIDLAHGENGTAKRKQNPWMSQILLPAIPIILGFLYGAFVPFRPDTIEDYVATHENASIIIVGGVFGIVIGQFSDYIYTKISKGIKGFAEAKQRRSLRPPAVPEEARTSGENGAK
jgi:hypothetical protein